MKTTLCYLGLFIVLGCKSLDTAPYDVYAYERTRQLQQQTLELLAKSQTTYSENTAEIGEITRKISELKAYELQRSNNTITQQLWKVLDDGTSGILPTLFQEWETQKTLSVTFREEAQKQVNEAFEVLKHWELQKEKTLIFN